MPGNWGGAPHGALPATPVNLLHEHGHGAQVRVSHLLHQHHIVPSQDLQEVAGVGLSATSHGTRPGSPAASRNPALAHLCNDAAAGRVRHFAVPETLDVEGPDAQSRSLDRPQCPEQGQQGHGPAHNPDKWTRSRREAARELAPGVRAASKPRRPPCLDCGFSPALSWERGPALSPLTLPNC